MKNLGKTQGQIDCIPNNEEKCISFSKSVTDENKKFKYKILFIDSLKFMSSSLDKLVNNLEPDHFKNLKEQFSDIEWHWIVGAKGNLSIWLVWIFGKTVWKKSSTKGVILFKVEWLRYHRQRLWTCIEGVETFQDHSFSRISWSVSQDRRSSACRCLWKF